MIQCGCAGSFDISVWLKKFRELEILPVCAQPIKKCILEILRENSLVLFLQGQVGISHLFDGVSQFLALKSGVDED